jgi:hypothetical protein
MRGVRDSRMQGCEAQLEEANEANELHPDLVVDLAVPVDLYLN